MALSSATKAVSPADANSQLEADSNIGVKFMGGEEYDAEITGLIHSQIPWLKRSMQRTRSIEAW